MDRAQIRYANFEKSVFLLLKTQHLRFRLQDGEIAYIVDSNRGAAGAVIPTTLHPADGNDSADENDVDENTMSGENDVEYAEFSMTLQMSPKEPPTAATAESQAHGLMIDDNVAEEFRNLNRIREEFMAEISDDEANVPSKESLVLPMGNMC